MLEVVAEGEVAQHLKVGAVTGSLAHTLNIRGTDALLAGGYTLSGRSLDAQEVVLHRRHAGVDEQQAVVILGDQPEGRQDQMSLALIEFEKSLTQVIYACPFHNRLSLLKTLCEQKIKKAPVPVWDESCRFHSSAVPPKLHRRSSSAAS